MKPEEVIEAIKELNDAIRVDGARVHTGTFFVAIDALEKQIPKRLIVEEGHNADEDGDWSYKRRYCPNCGIKFYDTGNMEDRYVCCPVCGQHLDWTEAEE